MNKNDILWKAILEDVFDDFLRFFYPNADVLFDFSKGFEYLDKELEQLFPPDANQYEPRYVDKLVKVFTREGQEEWILVHIEVQGYDDKHFARRMFRYYSRILDKYERRIAAFAIFTDDNAYFHPCKFELEYLGTKLTYTYNTYKIIDQTDAELADNANPFAMVALTVKTALKAKQKEENQLYDLKLDLVRRLLNKNISKAKIRSLMNFLRYYIRFENKEMARNFEKAVEVLTQKNTTMGIEEFLLDNAKKEGRKEGRKEGFISTAENLLKRGMSIQEVSEITTLSVREVTQVAKKLNKS